MTTYNKTKATHQTTVANTLDIVNLAADYNQVEVLNAATTNIDLWARTDGVAPTVRGDDCVRIPAGSVATLGAPDANATQVQLISSAAVDYSVTGVGG